MALKFVFYSFFLRYCIMCHEWWNWHGIHSSFACKTNETLASDANANKTFQTNKRLQLRFLRFVCLLLSWVRQSPELGLDSLLTDLTWFDLCTPWVWPVLLVNDFKFYFDDVLRIFCCAFCCCCCLCWRSFFSSLFLRANNTTPS